MDEKKMTGDEIARRIAAREIAVQLAYELTFRDMLDKTPEELIENILDQENFASLSDEDELYQKELKPDQEDYIKRLVLGIAAHDGELDDYIAKYSHGWRFERISRMARAIIKTAMYEVLYMQDVPDAAAINSAVELAKKYESPEIAKFINGVLGSFIRQERGN